jgi:hypothetical protein
MTIGLLSVGIETVFVGELHVGYSITTMGKVVKGLASPSQIVFSFDAIHPRPEGRGFLASEG